MSIYFIFLFCFFVVAHTTNLWIWNLLSGFVLKYSIELNSLYRGPICVCYSRPLKPAHQFNIFKTPLWALSRKHSLSDCTKWVTQTMHGYFGMAFAMKRDDIKGEMNVWRMNSFRKTTGCNLAHGPGGRLNRVKPPAPIQFLRDY